MRHAHVLAAVMALVLCGLGLGAEPPPLLTASGAVVKANANVLILRPRGADGKFGKALTLKVRGTSKVTTLTVQQRDGQAVPVQREVAVADLRPDQTLAVLYTNLGDEFVLLGAVAHPPAAK